MGVIKRTAVLVFLIICINCISGLLVPKPEKLVVDILDGEVTVLWKPPVDAPSNSRYNVQMAKYGVTQWHNVTSCTGITKTHCDLTSLIHDYTYGYKVKVQLVVGNDMSEWTLKKFLPNDSKLKPPTFTLWPTSSSLSVYIHQKPILSKLFPYGPIYTVYLEEKGQGTKNTTAYLRNDMDEDQRAATFSSLRSGTEYCVSMKVKGEGALFASALSPKQCVQLPEEEWFISAVTSLSLLGVAGFAAILATIILCYLRRPEKTPAVLKSPASGWLPLSVGEATPEVVTDKGWLLSSYRAEVKNSLQNSVSHLTVTVNKGEEDRRTSMDSGVGINSNSTTHSRESTPTRQEDSGFGSLGGTESSSSSQTNYPLEEERTDSGTGRIREDSGVGLGCQMHSSSVNLDGQDGESLKEVVAGGNYRTQRPSCGEEDAFKQMLHESVLAEVVTGYRAGPQSCICSGAGQCTWCHKQGLYGSGGIQQHRAVCVDNMILSGTCDFVHSYKGITFSGCPQKTNNATMNDFESAFTQLGETFPLLTALTPLPLVEEGQDVNMNNVSFSLRDVQLTAD